MKLFKPLVVSVLLIFIGLGIIVSDATAKSSSFELAEIDDSIKEQIEATRHMQPERKKLIKELIDNGIFIKIEQPSRYPRVYVGTSFYSLTFDDKKKLLNVVWTYYVTEDQKADILVLRDGYSGKDIGDYDMYGLKLK